MTNAEKYLTADERAKAFSLYCNGQDISRCPDDRRIACVHRCVECALRWLDMEAKEEKPLPCPFCGSNTVVTSYVTVRHVDNHLVECTNCQYRSEEKFDRDCAIAAHNRVARAVMEAEKKEETP